MKTETIEQSIQAYNQTSREIFVGKGDYNILEEQSKASQESIAILEKQTGILLPGDLKEFYTTIGGLANKNNEETHCLCVFTVDKLLEDLNHSSEWRQIRSLGIIDMIRYSWANDRYELDEDENLSKKDIDTLNNQYKCFGWYRTDTISETAYYLYFDKSGNFGELYYDQDTFHSLQDSLEQLLARSMATKTLEQLLLHALAQAQNAMIEWNS